MWNTPCSKCSMMSQSIFSNVDKDDIVELDSKKITTLYVKDQRIFYPGQLPIGIYCLGDGIVKFSIFGENGKEQIVRIATAGELMGIRALLSGRRYSTTSTALEDSMVCFINKRTFFKLCLKYPYISQKIMKSLSILLKEAEEKITSLAQKPVRERLAETLLTLNCIFKTGKTDCVEKNKGMISMTREDIANIIGTATETVIRILSDFKEDKLVEIKGRKIFIMDPERLEKIIKKQF